MDLVVGPWGARPTGPQPAGAADERDEGPNACTNCGAVITYVPGTETLACPYCDHVTPIARSVEQVCEHALDDALQNLGASPPPEAGEPVACTGCGASFSFDGPLHAGPCPYCGHAIVTPPGGAIQPTALLPFLVGEDQARERITRWLKSLWFAPGGLAKEARGRDALHGLYVPYFTFDSATETVFSGQRGDVYHEVRHVPVTLNGRRSMRAKRVPKIRWRPVSGRVARVFDDVGVVASRTLPEALVDRVGRFDTERARAFEPAFLTGFESERYQLRLADAFAVASAQMRRVVEGDVRARIGGDMQRITKLDIRHSDRRYKLALVPLWRAELRFAGRRHQVLVNGRTGAVIGERPFSLVKIAVALVLGALGIALVAFAVGAAPATPLVH